MHAMVFEGVGRPLRAAEWPLPQAGARTAAAASPGVRRLPHRSAPARRRAPDRRTRRASSGTRSSASCARTAATRSARGRTVARVDLRRVRATAARDARTSAAARASPGSTSTAASPSSPSPMQRFCFALPDGYPDDAGRAAALRRPHRLSRAAHARRRRGALGLYGFGAAAHIVAQVARSQGRAVFAFTRPATPPHRSSRASSAPPGPAAPDDAPRAAGRGAHLRARRARSCPRRCARRQGRDGRVRRHPHERHPGFPYDMPLGRARRRSVANLTRATPRSSWRSRRGCRSRPGHRVSAGRGQPGARRLAARADRGGGGAYAVTNSG